MHIGNYIHTVKLLYIHHPFVSQHLTAHSQKEGYDDYKPWDSLPAVGPAQEYIWY